MSNRVQAVQQRRRSNAAGPHPLATRQGRDAAIAQALADDPIAGVRMRQYVTAVEEGPSCSCGRPDSAHCDQCWRCPGDPHDEACGW